MERFWSIDALERIHATGLEQGLLKQERTAAEQDKSRQTHSSEKQEIGRGFDKPILYQNEEDNFANSF